MTTRNFRVTYWILSLLSFAVLIGAIGLSVRIGTDKRLPFFLADARLYTEYFLLGIPIGIHLAEAAEMVVLSLGISALVVTVLFTFQKTVSAEVYLLALWALLVDAEALRLVMLLVAQRSTSIGVLVSLTRFVYGARFSGLIALFISGLYAVGIGHERPQTGYLLSLLFGAMFAMLMPISIDRFQSSFMLQAGYREITIIVTGALLEINFLDYLVAARLKEDVSYAFVGGGLTAAGVVWVWLWEQRPLVLSLAGAAFFSLCVFASIQRLHRIYLWK